MDTANWLRLGLVALLMVATFSQSSATQSGVTIPASSTCSHINAEYTACEVATMCNLCIATSGCQFNVEDLSCVARSDVTNSNSTKYCSTDDSVCADCVSTAADSVCTGEDNECICQSLCSDVEPAEDSGCSDQNSFLLYIGLAVGLICLALLVFMAIKFNHRRTAAAWQDALASQHRRESELLRLRQPHLALNLVGWRDTVDLDKPQLHKLRACCYAMDKGKRKDSADDTRSMGAVAAIAVDDVEPSTSMETSSTFSDVESPLSNEAMAFPQPQENESNSDYSAINDCGDPNAANSARDKSR